MEIIQLKQNAIISTSGIDDARAQLLNVIESANIDNLVVTGDTLKHAKAERAKVTKFFNSTDGVRKLTKQQILKPLEEFEKEFKEKITTPYKEAKEALDKKINYVEDTLKEQKTEELKAYFTTLCEAKELDFVTFEDANLNVTLSKSIKSLKDELIRYTDKVVADLATIEVLNNSDEFKSDVVANYKQTKDVQKSIATLTQIYTERRKQKEIEEQKKKELVEKELNKAGFEKVEEAKEGPKKEPKQEVQQPEILQAPTEITPAPIVIAKFQASGTMEQLKALGEYMKNNNIEYSNI